MPILLHCGDNALEIEESVLNVRRRFESADVLSFEGAGVPLPTLSEACLTAGLFDPERLVIVHDLQQRLKSTRKEATDADEIERILHAVPPTTTLLLASTDMPADQPLGTMVRGAGGEIQEHTIPKKGELSRWIAGRAKHHRATIDSGAAELLADLIGPVPVQLDTELAKLATYAGEGARITPLMVETLVGAVTQESIFALVDAVAAGNQGAALRLLQHQLDSASSGTVEFALYLIRMLARQMRFLLRIRLGQEAGKSQNQIVSDLKLPRYFAGRYFQQARRLSRDRLLDAFERLAALEYSIKSGTSEPAHDLYLLVADLCG